MLLLLLLMMMMMIAREVSQPKEIDKNPESCWFHLDFQKSCLLLSLGNDPMCFSSTLEILETLFPNSVALAFSRHRHTNSPNRLKNRKSNSPLGTLHYNQFKIDQCKTPLLLVAVELCASCCCCCTTCRVVSSEVSAPAFPFRPLSKYKNSIQLYIHITYKKNRISQRQTHHRHRNGDSRFHLVI